MNSNAKKSIRLVTSQHDASPDTANSTNRKVERRPRKRDKAWLERREERRRQRMDDIRRNPERVRAEQDEQRKRYEQAVRPQLVEDGIVRDKPLSVARRRTWKTLMVDQALAAKEVDAIADEIMRMPPVAAQAVPVAAAAVAVEQCTATGTEPPEVQRAWQILFAWEAYQNALKA